MPFSWFLSGWNKKGSYSQSPIQQIHKNLFRPHEINVQMMGWMALHGWDSTYMITIVSKNMLPIPTNMHTTALYIHVPVFRNVSSIQAMLYLPKFVQKYHVTSDNIGT